MTMEIVKNTIQFLFLSCYFQTTGVDDLNLELFKPLRRALFFKKESVSVRIGVNCESI